MYYLKRVLSLPPSIVVKKILGKFTYKARILYHRQHDVRFPTFTKRHSSPKGKLNRSFQPVPLGLLQSHTNWISAVSKQYLSHHFDLLGSGWVQVRHGMKCRGVEGYVYDVGLTVKPDKDGHWLEGRINKANLTESKCIWRLIDEDYIPIDWHLDFKSGYRWSEDIWYRDVPYGHKPGVDIKVPWELARMQHLPVLVWAYALSKGGHEGFKQHEVYSQEFCNQVLDFIATNPPRFGVNWQCTMDVAIRVANLLAAYDLFRAYGVVFDKNFEAIFTKSIYEHGLHIINNLEWSAELRGNHYLANIVGLLYVAAYLPRTNETDVWLALAVQELVNEVGYQFTSDGANFEASTSYHRLSAEMVVYGTALVMGFPSEKLAALKDYDYRLHRGIPELKHAPTQFYPIQQRAGESPFPEWYRERLDKMALFTMHTTRPDGHIPQIGDNDSGRFFKFHPVFCAIPVAKTKDCYINLEGYHGLPDTDIYWLEDHNDHRHLVSAINGLFQRQGLSDFAGDKQIEYDIVKLLCNNNRFFFLDSDKKTSFNKKGKPDNGLALYAYPGFGLYIYKSRCFYFAVRCGHIGQNGNGGHAHNDQLSIVLAVNGLPIIVDPGTYLYTPAPAKRNLFRSTEMHNTLRVAGKEQNDWHEGRAGLFSMLNQAKAKTIKAEEREFVGEHYGFGIPHRRVIEIHEKRIVGFDECKEKGEKVISFLLAPDVKTDSKDGGKAIDLHSGHVVARMSTDQGKWAIYNAFYSSAYGIIQKSQMLKLESTEESLRWVIEFS